MFPKEFRSHLSYLLFNFAILMYICVCVLTIIHAFIMFVHDYDNITGYSNIHSFTVTLLFVSLLIPTIAAHLDANEIAFRTSDGNRLT